MFQPAASIQDSEYLKVLVYGPDYVGKTQWALESFGKKAVIDTDNGTNFFKKKYNFDVVRTQSYEQLEQAVQHIKKNPNKYNVLIVDSLTHIYQTVKDEAIETRTKDKGPSNIAVTEGEWGVIKQKFGSLVSSLCFLPCHVIITAFSKDAYETIGNKKKKNGTRPDVDSKIQYWPDVRIRLEKDLKSGNHFGIIEKDRTSTYQVGQKIKDISFNDFLPAVSVYPVAENTLQQIKSLWTSMELDPSKINLQTEKTYGVYLHDLTEEQGLDFLTKLQAKANEDQSEQENTGQSEQESTDQSEAPSSNVTELKSKMTAEQRNKIFKSGGNKGLKTDDVKKIAYTYTKLDSMTKMTKQQARDVINFIENSTLEELQNYIKTDEMKGAV